MKITLRHDIRDCIICQEQVTTSLLVTGGSPFAICLTCFDLLVKLGERAKRKELAEMKR